MAITPVVTVRLEPELRERLDRLAMAQRRSRTPKRSAPKPLSSRLTPLSSCGGLSGAQRENEFRVPGVSRSHKLVRALQNRGVRNAKLLGKGERGGVSSTLIAPYERAVGLGLAPANPSGRFGPGLGTR
jgi:hypothetical protein